MGKNVEKRGKTGEKRKKSKKMKKVLDKTGQRWYSIKAVASGGPGERVSEKKFLTSSGSYDIMAELTRAAEKLAGVHLVN